MTDNITKPPTMARVNVSEIQANPSYMERVEGGEKQAEKPRRVGIDRGMTVPPIFFEPLPDTLLDAFERRIEPE